MHSSQAIKVNSQRKRNMFYLTGCLVQPSKEMRVSKE